MPISIDLRPEVEERLGREASAKGVTIESYVEDLIERQVFPPHQSSQINMDDLDGVLDALAEGSDDRPTTPPEAYMRESI